MWPPSLSKRFHHCRRNSLSIGQLFGNPRSSSASLPCLYSCRHQSVLPVWINYYYLHTGDQNQSLTHGQQAFTHWAITNVPLWVDFFFLMFHVIRVTDSMTVVTCVFLRFVLPLCVSAVLPFIDDSIALFAHHTFAGLFIPWPILWLCFLWTVLRWTCPCM